MKTSLPYRPAAWVMLAMTLCLSAHGQTTLPATAITATNATLNGSINANGETTGVYFQYGATTNYDNTTPVATVNGTNDTAVNSSISGLSPGINYHFQLVVTNSAGTNYGGDLNFTTLGLAPTVTTQPASNVTTTSATLTGAVNPNGAATSFYFQYGPDTNYGSFTVTNNLDSGTNLLALSNTITGLAPGATYHFQIVASNSAGISSGDDVAFTTLGLAPTATTQTASNVTATSSTLNGAVNPNGTPTSFYFQYGLDTNYGSFTATNNLDSGTNLLAVSNTITGLASGATYHFQIVASNSAGISSGDDLAFTTLGLTPTATTQTASNVTANSATLNGAVNPNGTPTSFYFQYGPDNNYGNFTVTNNLDNGTNLLAVSNTITGLTPGATYHFQIVASNSAGISSGDDLAFTTLGLTPTATTQTASNVTATSATLNGAVNPNGAATSFYFQYGLDTNYGSFTATNNLDSGTNLLAVSNTITGLASGATYHFQIVASNSAGISSGDDLAFTTLGLTTDRHNAVSQQCDRQLAQP